MGRPLRSPSLTRRDRVAGKLGLEGRQDLVVLRGRVAEESHYCSFPAYQFGYNLIAVGTGRQAYRRNKLLAVASEPGQGLLDCSLDIEKDDKHMSGHVDFPGITACADSPDPTPFVEARGPA